MAYTLKIDVQNEGTKTSLPFKQPYFSFPLLSILGAKLWSQSSFYLAKKKGKRMGNSRNRTRDLLDPNKESFSEHYLMRSDVLTTRPNSHISVWLVRTHDFCGDFLLRLYMKATRVTDT